MIVIKVEADIASIAASPIALALMLVIMYVLTSLSTILYFLFMDDL
jgi:hypothetical protein